MPLSDSSYKHQTSHAVTVNQSSPTSGPGVLTSARVPARVARARKSASCCTGARTKGRCDGPGRGPRAGSVPARNQGIRFRGSPWHCCDAYHSLRRPSRPRWPMRIRRRSTWPGRYCRQRSRAAAPTLPISEVPNLAAGDRIWIKADLPPTQSAHYLLVAAFLRGSTNPPPPNWFFNCETWTKPVQPAGADGHGAGGRAAGAGVPGAGEPAATSRP